MTAYAGWAVVELMGHRTLGGWISEAQQYGISMLRVDVPGPVPEGALNADGQRECTRCGCLITAVTPRCDPDDDDVRHEFVDVPVTVLDAGPPIYGGVIATQFYGGSAIYCVTPCDEQVARRAARSGYNRPTVLSIERPAPDDLDDDDDELQWCEPCGESHAPGEHF